MQTVYMVSLYSSHKNERSRVVCTAASEEEAKQRALDEWGYRDSSVLFCEAVCTTADEPFMKAF